MLTLVSYDLFKAVPVRTCVAARVWDGEFFVGDVPAAGPFLKFGEVWKKLVDDAFVDVDADSAVVFVDHRGLVASVKGGDNAETH